MAKDKTLTSSTNLDIDSGKGRSNESAFDPVESGSCTQTTLTHTRTLVLQGNIRHVLITTNNLSAATQAISLQGTHPRPTDAHTDELVAKLSQELRKLEEANFLLEEELAKVSTDRNALERNVKDLQQKLNEQTKEFSDNKQECAQLQVKIKCLEEEIKRLTKGSQKQTLGLIFANDYVKELGAGNFGVVHLMKNNTDGKYYAVKLIWLPNEEQERVQCLKEAKVFSSLSHEHIVRYHHAEVETAPSNWETVLPWSSLLRVKHPVYLSRECTYSSPPRCLCIFMEYCDGGTLEDWLQNHPHRSSQEVMDIFAQILQGVCCIHAKKITHGDLTTANIFVTAGKVFKVGDLGISKYWSSQEGGESKFFLSSGCPEGYTQASHMKKVDIFFLGHILLRMMYPSLSNTNEDFLHELCACICEHFFGDATPKNMVRHVQAFIKKYYNIAKLIATLIQEPEALDISDARMLLESPKYKKMYDLAYLESDEEAIDF